MPRSTTSRPLPLRRAAALFDLIVSGDLPADKQMEQFFRAHPDMGARDRGWVAESVYACLRRRRQLEWIADQAALPARGEVLVAAWLLLHAGWSARALQEAGFAGDAAALSAHARGVDDAPLPPAVRTNLPDWLFDALLAQLGETETLALAAALNEPAPLDLRVNALKATRETLAACLADAGFPVTNTPWSPLGLRRAERAPLFNTQCFRDGWFEVQDEGSQLIAFLLAPRRREMVVDFCAGAGGKTLQLGAMMANSGTLYAFDVASWRLERLKPRLKRAGLDNARLVTLAHERDARVQRLTGKIDRVLVDAPCSGTGTLRRNPDIKWRALNLAELTANQQRILAAAAGLVKPGGRLVYATCSLLKAENDDIVDAFLAAQPAFRVLPAAELLARRDIPAAQLGLTDAALRLYPHRHGTDAFYAVALERTKSS